MNKIPPPIKLEETEVFKNSHWLYVESHESYYREIEHPFLKKVQIVYDTEIQSLTVWIIQPNNKINGRKCSIDSGSKIAIYFCESTEKNLELLAGWLTKR